MQDHWDVYEKGAEMVSRDLLALFSKVPESLKKQYQAAHEHSLMSCSTWRLRSES